MRANPLRVVLVEDHRSLLELLARFIDAAIDFEVVGTAVDGYEGLRLILERTPDIAVLDVMLPGRGAFDIAKDIVARRIGTKLVFFTGFLTDLFLAQALRVGASGYLLKGEPIENVLDALRRVALGEAVFSEEVQKRLTYDSLRQRHAVVSESRLSELTPRQLEIMRHLALGRSVKEVARIMHLSEKSVDNHKGRIMHKLDIHDRVELARFAIREGLTLP